MILSTETSQPFNKSAALAPKNFCPFWFFKYFIRCPTLQSLPRQWNELVRVCERSYVKFDLSWANQVTIDAVVTNQICCFADTPRRIPMLHTTSWVMNIFAIFFILAAHEHYSIDVFVAFYITSRLFLYYHSLANNLVLRQPDRSRTRVWFPLFSYFESSISGIVPNEYEWPFTSTFRQIARREKSS